MGRTLARATPVTLTGLAGIVGMKAGLFNIGAQGQLLFGAVFAAWIGYRFTDLPSVLHVPARLARRRRHRGCRQPSPASSRLPGGP